MTCGGHHLLTTPSFVCLNLERKNSPKRPRLCAVREVDWEARSARCYGCGRLQTLRARLWSGNHSGPRDARRLDDVWQKVDDVWQEGGEVGLA